VHHDVQCAITVRAGGSDHRCHRRRTGSGVPWRDLLCGDRRQLPRARTLLL